MRTVDFLVFLIFVVVVIWHSSQVWFDPKGFVVRMQHIRAGLHKYSFGLLLPKAVKEYLDNHPENEIVIARAMFIIVYLLVIYIAIVSLI